VQGPEFKPQFDQNETKQNKKTLWNNVVRIKRLIAKGAQ
jgi:hypothetical protein